MNRPVHPVASEYVPAYGADGYGWAMAQARLIRERRWQEIDRDNVAEEIESAGRSEWRTVESALRVTLLHQLRWRHQVTFRSRSRNSIEGHLQQFDEELADNPGLEPRLEDIRARAYRRARIEAARETGLPIEIFPVDPPSWDEIRAPLED